MKAKVFVKDDGSVSILRLDGCGMARLDDDESDEAYLDRVALVTIEKNESFQGLSIVNVEVDELPEYDSATRDKWRWDGSKVIVDETIGD